MTGREPTADAFDRTRRRAGDEVSCLACGTVYSKPLRPVHGRGWACPACGHAGWLAVAVIGSRDVAPRDAAARSAA